MARPPHYHSSIINLLTVKQQLLKRSRGGFNPFDQSRHFTPDQQQQQQDHFTDTARQVCEIIRTRPRWEQTILSQFPSQTLFDPTFVDQIINHQTNPLLSLRFLTWIRTHQSLDQYPNSCHAFFDRLVQSNASKAAHSLLRSLPPQFAPKFQSLESLIQSLSRDGRVEETLDVFSKLNSIGATPSVSVFNSALIGAIRVQRSDLFWGLYREMIECGLIGDAETAGYLIRAFCRDGKVDEAYELLRQVLDSGVVVTDSVAFAKLVSGFCKLRNYDRVSEILHVMIAKNCAPNVFTYQEIIHGLCRNGMGSEGFRVFGDLKRRGYAPDLVMYTTMIDGLCKMGRIGDARKLWFELIRDGFAPNEYTYNVFIDGNFKHGNVGEAKRLYEEMCGREWFRLSVLNCNTMVSGFCLNGRMDEACEMFEGMLEKGMEPDVITYNTMIQGFCKVGKTVEAVNMYGKLIEKGLRPSPATYTPMIQALCDNGDVKEAIGLWNDMQCRGVEPLVCTHEYIINGLCKQGNAGAGMEWMVSMLQNKLRPLRKTFDGLIECLASKGLLDDALLALHYMFGMGYVLGKPALNSLLGQLCKDDSFRASERLEGILDGN
ncbi:hypothetical protein Sjap_005900 [Stephania japonica]|uniref:Pentatricopeptide repeat-containing protein n=1 Tax=Stephania japonica TaxID=461633 RepID=A0AAP0K7C9_9MAGN